MRTTPSKRCRSHIFRWALCTFPGLGLTIISSAMLSAWAPMTNGYLSEPIPNIPLPTSLDDYFVPLAMYPNSPQRLGCRSDDLLVLAAPYEEDLPRDSDKAVFGHGAALTVGTFGLPFPAMRSISVTSFYCPNNTLMSGNSIDSYTPCDPQTHDRLQDLLTASEFKFPDSVPTRDPDRRIPTIPLWSGITLNTLFYATILYTLWQGPCVLIRHRRRRTGRCPACGYDLKSDYSTGCPECGWNREQADTLIDPCASSA